MTRNEISAIVLDHLIKGETSKVIDWIAEQFSERDTNLSVESIALIMTMTMTELTILNGKLPNKGELTEELTHVRLAAATSLKRSMDYERTTNVSNPDVGESEPTDNTRGT